MLSCTAKLSKSPPGRPNSSWLSLLIKCCVSQHTFTHSIGILMKPLAHISRVDNWLRILVCFVCHVTRPTLYAEMQHWHLKNPHFPKTLSITLFHVFTGISKYSTGRHHVRNFGYYMFLRQRSVDISFISLRTRRFIEFPAPPGVTWLLNQIKLQDTQLEFYFKQNYKTSRTSQIYIK